MSDAAISMDRQATVELRRGWLPAGTEVLLLGAKAGSRVCHLMISERTMDFNADFVGADDWVCKKYVNELEIPGNKGEESSGAVWISLSFAVDDLVFSGGLSLELPAGWLRNFAKFTLIVKLRAGICRKQQGSA